ncbi:MAG TPA: 4-(cytidine 5'-diphospho)-2-C-methyl-D-erythritol kinase, partial [Rhizomicrobium sp.]
MRARIAVAAPAKVNLCLHVGDKQANGYHDLQSLVAFVTHEDRLFLELDDDISLSVTGPFAPLVPQDSDNLVLRAARRLAEKIGARHSGARIALEKNIPAVAGLGGGSADAAAVLRGLVRLWNVDIAQDELRELAAPIGADVPVCIGSAASWMEGRGERVTWLYPLPSAWLLLVNPGVPVPTAAVFGGLKQRSGVGLQCPSTKFADIFALVAYLRSTNNDLEAPARIIAPVIDTVLDDLAGLSNVLLARMSGSGATCFGIFPNSDDLHSAHRQLKAQHPEWWMAGVQFA